MNLLKKIKSPADVRKLGEPELNELCDELREFLLNSVSKTGGHLASNLGVVELTVAIHRVFDTSKDRLVFDVGHQSYVHKLLTGRSSKFETLREFGGLSVFRSPRRAFMTPSLPGMPPIPFPLPSAWLGPERFSGAATVSLQLSATGRLPVDSAMKGSATPEPAGSRSLSF